ncbi:MAG TPA: Rid family hydrolase [Pseudobacteroides sp.]|uniref:Rid family hydrolase n=1 Tax=Pseudobacteroides sp. TaxID=1968840 RepID=UPI002F9263EC
MISEFNSSNCTEYFLTLELPDRNYMFNEIVEIIFGRYNEICKKNGLDKNFLIYIRIYLSDIYNQASYVKEYLHNNYNSVFYILVGQAPASGAKIALESYFCKPLNEVEIEKNVEDNLVSFKHGAYLTKWGNITPGLIGDSYIQTDDLFNKLTSQVNDLGGNIKDNVLRTWIYVRDIDNNYSGMAKCRNKWFESEDMTKDTHYIASTGIEGKSVLPSTLVQLSYISSIGLNNEQVVFMSAPDYMNPTHEYGVTFERGTKVVYGDRTHYYISGTASIDNKGNVLFPTDVIKQIERAFINIEALLLKYSAGLNDMKIMIIYLRDYSDYQIVQNYITERFKDTIPYVILNASVCRPLWLVEIECVAINNKGNEKFKIFL